MRVLFIHGKEGSPNGSKPRAMREHFQVHAVGMDTDDFEGSVSVQADAIERFEPDVVVGSSFGGAVACVLLDRNLWLGPTVLLAQASELFGHVERLPRNVPVVLVHAPGDDIVSVEGSRKLAATGTPAVTKLYEPNDDHRLSRTVQGGALPKYVREAYSLARYADV